MTDSEGVRGGSLRRLRSFDERPFEGGFEWHYTLPLEAFVWCDECERAYRWGDTFLEYIGPGPIIVCAFADGGCDGVFMCIHEWVNPEFGLPAKDWPIVPASGHRYPRPRGWVCYTKVDG